MTKKKMPTVFEVLKSQYALAVKNVLSSETRLRNAKARQKTINQAMTELGYSVKVVSSE